MGEDSNPTEYLFDVLRKYWAPVVLGVIGIILIIIGSGLFIRESKPTVEFNSDDATRSALLSEMIVDIAGAVEKPGVYRLPLDSRIAEALEKAGGVSSNANTDWIAKNLNLAGKLTDGSKLYIPSKDKAVNVDIGGVSGVTTSEGKININTASSSRLDTLYGVGPATAEKIIDNRPYATIEELREKKVVGEKTFEKIKDEITVF